MESGPFKVLDVDLYRRGQYLTALARALSVLFAAVSLVFIRDNPGTRARAVVATLLVYVALAAVSFVWRRRHPTARGVKIAHDVVDAVAVGVGSAFTGGLDSPFWLLLYPHVVAVAVRGGLAYALAMGMLDAVIVSMLTALTPHQPLGMLHALALPLCAFMAGKTSSHLVATQERQEQALAALRASEKRYERLLERIQDGVVIVREGRIVYANQVFAALAGHLPQALLGLDFRDLVPPGDRAELSERYRRWEQSQAVSGVLETRLLTHDGASVLVSLRAGSAEFEGERAVIATIRDITREREMEEDVKAHAGRLAGINEVANAVNLSLTVEDIASVVAEEARRLLPFDRVTIALLEDEGARLEVVAPGMGMVRQRTAFPRPAVAWSFRRPLVWCQGDAEPAPAHFPLLMPDRELKAIATVPLLSKDRVIGSLNFGRRQPLAFSGLDLAVLESVGRHIAIALDNARLLEAVRRRGHEFESLLDIGRRIGERLDLEELLPMVARSVNRVMTTAHCLLLLREGDLLRVVAQEGMEPEVVAAFRDLRVGDSLSGWVIQEGRILSIEDMRQDPRLMFGDLVHRFGYRSYLGVPLRRESEILGTLEVVTKGETRRFGPDEQALMMAFADQAAVAIDNARLLEEGRHSLDRVVEANRQLEALDRLRRDYLRNVGHEFRTPLTVIRGYAEFLLDSGGAPAVRDVMRVVVESCDRLIDLVETLIEVSRVEQEGAEKTLEVRPLDLQELAVSSIDTLRPAADRKGVRVDLQFPTQPLPLLGDRGLLHHLVRKLVDNAVKYSPAGAQVLVRGAADEGELTLEVEDFGIGIPAEHVPRIFEKFYMVDSGIARRAGGTGVGLYLVREIVRLHHGTVAVDSRPGQGSVFRVRLPRSLSPQAALA